jgi:signal peptide peptidase SppA
MPSTFRSQLDAALARPAMLDPRALDEVRAARGFRPRSARPAGAIASSTQDSVLLSGPNDDVAIVDVQGPLAQRAWSCWMFEGDGYDAITARVHAALAEPKANAVVLRVDSPGGEVAGCFEAVRAIRAAAKASSKPLVVYVDELAASAAYALASAADEIVLPESGCAGSIGVIVTMVKRDKQLERDALSVHVITSGKRKADGHPGVAATDDELAAIQAEVDTLAQLFAEHVAIGRGGDAAKWLGLEAGCFFGADAVSHGLADRVGGFDVAVERARELAAARRSPGRVPAKRGEKTMSTLMLIAATLGLAATASEETVAAEAQKRENERRELLKLTGAEDGDGALGTVKAWKGSHERVGQLEADEKKRAADEEKREREQLVTALRASGKLSADMEAELIPSMSVAQLRAFAKTAAPIVPAGKPAVEPTGASASSGRLVGPDGKTYEQLSNAERKALQRNSPELFAAMRDDAERHNAI